MEIWWRKIRRMWKMWLGWGVPQPSSWIATFAMLVIWAKALSYRKPLDRTVGRQFLVHAFLPSYLSVRAKPLFSVLDVDVVTIFAISNNMGQKWRMSLTSLMNQQRSPNLDMIIFVVFTQFLNTAHRINVSSYGRLVKTMN